MDCAKFGEVLHDLDRPGTEGFAVRESALAHAESCDRCAPLLMRTESLDLALRAIAEREAGRQAPPRVGTALMEEFRRAKTASSRRRVRLQIAALGAAAVALLALGLTVRWFPSAHQGKVTTQVAGSSAQAADASAASGEQSVGVDSEDAAFIPLPYADDPAAVEDDAVVRVVLSRSALASLGLPVPETDGGELVSADLRVSEDGTPQAVRLVSQENSN